MTVAPNEVDSSRKREIYPPARKKVSCATTTATTVRPKENPRICPDVYKNREDDERGPYRDCRVSGFGIVQKIPYHDETLNIMDVPFSSACIRCGLCLVIADKINKTLMDVHDAMSPDRWLSEEEMDDLFKMICDQSFLRYRLREIDNERYIGESLPGSNIVESTANGLWAPNLKIKCNELLEGIGTTKLYKQWQECRGNNMSKNLATILCNSDVGMLRDCRSIADAAYYPDTEEKPFHAGVKIKAAFNCN